MSPVPSVWLKDCTQGCKPTRLLINRVVTPKTDPCFHVCPWHFPAYGTVKDDLLVLQGDQSLELDHPSEVTSW
jgi:hypothetical protein